MPGHRAGAIQAAWLLSMLVSGALTGQPVRADSALPWHLSEISEDCRTCLGMEDVWSPYGEGHPDIAVLVAEPEIFADTRSAASWHAGIGRQRLELPPRSGVPRLVSPEPPHRALGARQSSQKKGLALLDEFDGEPGRVRSLGPLIHRPRVCSFVRKSAGEGPRNHDLQMASLIGGQPYRGTKGVAPGIHLILTKATITPKDVPLLTDLVARRPEIRVINISQGQGQAEDAIAVETARPHGVHYQKLNGLVMELSVAGMLETRSRTATRFLVVASAGNVAAFETNIFEPREVLDVRIPPEAIHHAPPTPVYVDLRPHYLLDLPRLDLPLIVVGAVGADGTMASYGRTDHGIDLYAPAGIDWISQVRLSMPEKQSVGGGEWRECVCAALTRAHPLFDVDPRTRRTCSDVEERQLGVPALDFHMNSASGDDTPIGLRLSCADSPNGLCTSIADGTSAATALVSGVAALMFSLDPTRSGEEVAEILKSTARTDNPLRLPVIDPSKALQVVAKEIGTRVIDGLRDPAQLSAQLGLPFYYLLQGEDPFASTRAGVAADVVARSFASLGRGHSWRVRALDDGRLQRCDAGTAGSTLGLRELLQGQDACADDDNGVEILRLELDVSDGLIDLAVGMVLRRAGRLGPDTGWRVAGLNVRRGERNDAP